MSDPTVAREQMPQVNEKDIAKLIVFMAKGGIGVTAGETSPDIFTGHQGVDLTKVNHMRNVNTDILAKPVLVTKQFEVIDGNHRLMGHRLNETLVPYLKFDCSFVEALNMLAVFPFAYELTSLTSERN